MGVVLNNSTSVAKYELILSDQHLLDITLVTFPLCCHFSFAHLYLRIFNIMFLDNSLTDLCLKYLDIPCGASSSHAFFVYLYLHYIGLFIYLFSVTQGCLVSGYVFPHVLSLRHHLFLFFSGNLLYCPGGPCSRDDIPMPPQCRD